MNTHKEENTRVRVSLEKQGRQICNMLGPAEGPFSKPACTTWAAADSAHAYPAYQL